MMLHDDQLTQLCQNLGLSKEAQAIIENVRSSPPTRRVRGGAGNVSVRYPSRKMGVTIQAESHRNELAGIYEKEHDPNTLEYYDQPPPIKLIYPAKNGRLVGVLHTPDFFVIRTDSVGWEEWKPEEELPRLAERMPHRYVRTEDGRWCCPPGERYAASCGFFYRVRSSAEIDWVFQRNLLFLEDYLRGDCPPVSEPSCRAIWALVVQAPGIRLDELLGQVVGARSDDVYTLIATERLVVDLRAAPLAEPERVRVFRDAETARAYATLARTSSWSPESTQHSVLITRGSPVSWDGRSWTLLNPGQTTITLQADDGTLVELANGDVAALIARGKLTGVVAPLGMSAEARELLAHANPDDFREANRRYALIASRLGLRPLDTIPVGSSTPPRTLRFWLAKWRAAEQIHHCGYVGLLPRVGRSGNRQRKLPEATLRLLDEFITRDYETLKQKHKLEVYGALVRTCAERGVVVPSYYYSSPCCFQRLKRRRRWHS